MPVDVRRLRVAPSGGTEEAGMFERFTDRARKVVVLAQEEARVLGHNYIGTEHLLLGLCSEGSGVGAVVLEDAGLSLPMLRADVQRIIGEVSGAPQGQIPFTPRAKKVLELALREALKLSHNYIGTEHILLGIVAEGEGVAAQILVSHDLGPEEVRARVVEKLGLTGERSTAVRGGPLRTQRGRPSPPYLGSEGITRATADIGLHARQLALGEAQTSAHLLRALVAATDSQAGRALASLGVTADAVDQALTATPVEGTTDESREDAIARVARIRTEDDRVVIELTDADLARRLAGRSAELSGSLAEVLDRLRSTLRREANPDEPSGGASMEE
jgi:ATP-dependent Clp protease ATP-binding subunit ClpC